MKAFVATLLLVQPAVVSAAACTPQVQWIWDGPSQGGGFPEVCVTPLVVQLDDDNLDGRIDTADTPDVVFTHQSTRAYEAVLTALDGATGAEHWTASSPLLKPTALAGGDIDGDGLVDIVAVHADGFHLVAFDRTGGLLWVSDPAPTPLYEFSAMGIADLDQDGSPEIYSGATVWGANGRLRWSGSAGRGAEGYWNLITISNAVDLDPAVPGMELLAGNTLYSATGAVLWQNSALTDGFTAVGDLDRDGSPEILLASNSELHVLDATGQELGPSWNVPGRVMSQPVIADLDGDGMPEAVAINDFIVDAVNWNGTAWARKWSAATSDDTRLNGASAFDLDGDGAAELFYHDSWRWYIFDGRSGAALSVLDYASATTIEVPVIADLDHDCVPEILVTGCQGGISAPSPSQVIAYECVGSRPARPMWNSYGYHVTNVNDDGTIPRFEAQHWLGRNSWHEQVRGGGPAAVAGPDVEACLGAQVTLDGSASGGCAAGYEYRWREATTTLCDWSGVATCSVTASVPAATYSLDLRCAGLPDCEATASVSVTAVTPPVARAGSDRSVCEGVAVTLDGSGSSAPGCATGLLFEWREGATVLRPASANASWNPPTTPPGARTYTLVTWCSSGARCEAVDDVVVELRDCPLSVRFGSHAARRSGSGTEVEWTTLSEHGTLCFVVEGAPTSEGPWQAVPGCVEARGALAQYRVVDDGLGSSWYRIVEKTVTGEGDATPAFPVARTGERSVESRRTRRAGRGR